MRGNCANISGRSCSASLNPLVLKRKRKWKRKSLQCSSSTAALMSPCSRRMFVEITWFALVISPVHLKTAVSFRLTAVCESVASYHFYLLSVPCYQYVEAFFPSRGLFPIKKMAPSWMMQVGEKKKNFHYFTVEKQTFITPQTRALHSI